MIIRTAFSKIQTCQFFPNALHKIFFIRILDRLFGKCEINTRATMKFLAKTSYQSSNAFVEKCQPAVLRSNKNELLPKHFSKALSFFSRTFPAQQ